jgi:hypothetical protein
MLLPDQNDMRNLWSTSQKWHEESVEYLAKMTWGICGVTRKYDMRNLWRTSHRFQSSFLLRTRSCFFSLCFLFFVCLFCICFIAFLEHLFWVGYNHMFLSLKTQVIADINIFDEFPWKPVKTIMLYILKELNAQFHGCIYISSCYS